MKLFNGFSIKMLSADNEQIRFHKIGLQAVKRILANHKVDSYIIYPETASILSNMLGININYGRRYAKLEIGEQAIVAQIVGGRLEEGCTELPDDIRIEFYLIASCTDLLEDTVNA